MVNITSFQQIKTRVDRIYQEYNLTKKTDAFIYLLLQSLFDLNDDEITEKITDGYDDNAIDAIYIDDSKDTIYLLNTKYTEEFDKTKSNFPGSDLTKIEASFQKLQSKELLRKDCNPQLWSNIQEVYDLMDQKVLNYIIMICTNKEHPTDKDKDRFVESFLKNNTTKVEFYNQERIATLLTEGKNKKRDGQLQFISDQLFAKSDYNLKSIIGTISCNDLIELIKAKESDEIDANVFNENVRVYLGLKNEINEKIYNTALSDSNYEFWYLNNGICIVCDKFEYASKQSYPIVKIFNYQIINGCQTAHALYYASKKIELDKLKNIKVLIKLYETNEKDLLGRICESTNSQSPIVSRDLRANDKIQRQLEYEFIQLGYYYERKKNQFMDKEKNKRLDSETLAQIYLAFYLDKPSEAKNKKSELFASYYEDIFNTQTIHAVKLLLPYYIYLPLKDMKNTIMSKKRHKDQIDESLSFIPWAIFHLLFICKLISDHERIAISENNNKDLLTKSISMLQDIIEDEKKEVGKSYSNHNFFKETATNDKIRQFVSKYYK